MKRGEHYGLLSTGSIYPTKTYSQDNKEYFTLAQFSFISLN